LPEGTYRAAVMEAFGAELRIGAEMLDRLMADEAPPPAPPPQPRTAAKRKTRMQRAIALALHYPQAAARLERLERLDQLVQPGADLLRRVLETARSLPDVTTASLLESLREDPDRRYLERLIVEELLDDEDAAPQVLNDAVDLLVQEAKKTQVAEAVRSHRPGTTAD
jgi:DNA primase